MGNVIIGTAFLYEYNPTENGRLIFFATQQEVKKTKENTLQSVKNDLQEQMRCYLESQPLPISEMKVDLYESVVFKIENELKAQGKQPLEIEQLLQTPEIRARIKSEHKRGIEEEKNEYISRMMDFSFSEPNFRFHQKTPPALGFAISKTRYQQEIVDSLIRYMTDVHDTICTLTRLNFREDNKHLRVHELTREREKAVADEFSNIEEIIFISPYNLGYPGKNTSFLQDQNIMERITTPLQHGSKEPRMIKCIWTAEPNSKQNQTQLQNAQERTISLESRSLAVYPLSQNTYEHHFYSSPQVKLVLGDFETWMREGPTKKFQIDTPPIDDAQSSLSIQDRLTQLLRRNNKVYLSDTSGKKPSGEEDTVMTGNSGTKSESVQESTDKYTRIKL